MTRQLSDREKWLEIRERIKNSYEYNDDWKQAIELFNQRITDFYLKPIQKIKGPNSLKGEGFSIVTLQCALIEMLAAFKFGKIHNYKKRNTDPSFEYRKADECFIPFLQNEKIFENQFFIINEKGKKKLNVPFSANDFYDNVRCGLMHEARTKKNWVINARMFYHKSEVDFIKLKDGKVSIDRSIFHNLLENYFKEYLQDLSKVDSQNLRKYFARKLDHLYDIPRDENKFDWWKDN